MKKKSAKTKKQAAGQSRPKKTERGACTCPDPANEINFKKIMEALGETDVSEFEYSNGDMHIVIKKEPVGVMLGETEQETVPENTEEPVDTQEKEEAIAPPPSLRILKSPAVGTFRITDGDTLISSVGEKIKKGKKLGWVNSMGIKQDIITDKDAKITAIFCKDREVVEWGQKLFEIEEENV